MKVNTYSFEYNPKNLEMFKLDMFGGNLDIDTLQILIIITVIGLLLYMFSPLYKGYLLVKAEEKKKEDNKNKIKELIMMKEVQTELEQEIEESLLSAGLKASAI